MESRICVFEEIDYSRAWLLQERLFSEVRGGGLKSALVLCSHPPVITLGRMSEDRDLRVSPETLRKNNIPLYRTRRGGKTTYHGPGQVIAYPIIDLSRLDKDIHVYLRRLEGVILSLCLEFGVKAERRVGFTGCWVRGSKIASLGIAVRNWITLHGLSINVTRDSLRGFDLIRPCGMEIPMTCLETERGGPVDTERVKERLAVCFAAAFPSLFPGSADMPGGLNLEPTSTTNTEDAA